MLQFNLNFFHRADVDPLKVEPNPTSDWQKLLWFFFVALVAIFLGHWGLYWWVNQPIEPMATDLAGGATIDPAALHQAVLDINNRASNLNSLLGR